MNNVQSALKMREDDCRSLLCLQQNFAKMLKPQVQAVVTVSCFVVENYVDLKIVQVLAFMFYYNVNMKILKLELMLQIQFLLWGRKAPESRFCLCFSFLYFLSFQGIWQDAERNRKLCGNLRAIYYAKDSVNYAVKIANYVLVLEQMTRKNRSITRKNSKLCGRF